jgi:hypothetical protein
VLAGHGRICCVCLVCSCVRSSCLFGAGAARMPRTAEVEWSHASPATTSGRQGSSASRKDTGRLGPFPLTLPANFQAPAHYCISYCKPSMSPSHLHIQAQSLMHLPMSGKYMGIENDI